jgi:hypothetical protein
VCVCQMTEGNKNEKKSIGYKKDIAGVNFEGE